ncbi:MFS transporter [Agrococcus jejuensis]|uniref:Predicted arabinose efflux permease, MFS family n=1 Tax=Agrococcus jejuensis TaxID=399736 RepID=A0A1G8DHP7_9MICO|nr:MFS transporter [Agrococcus jejuensis]SDH57176.1 Predicted arabinose efflux permease, MFS family [Agrococcus jejuensis]
MTTTASDASSTPDPTTAPPTTTETVQPTRRTATRAAVAAGIGTAIEWYEYGLYGIVAGLVIAPLFFPEAEGAVGILATFATFAVGFVARPFGGIILGAASDRFGRRPVLVFSLLLVGIATTGIGLLPPYAAIGIWAPLLLVLLRLAQGFGAGAELAGAITIINESATRKHKASYSALAMAGGGIGGITASLLFTLISATVTGDAFVEWGWRIPFLLAAVFTVVGLVLRSKMHESPEFEKVQAEREVGEVSQARRNPFAAMAEAFRASPRNWLAGFLVPSSLNTTGFVVTAFGVSYLAGQLGLERSQTLVVSLSVTVCMVIALVFFGRLGDRIGSKRVMWIGIVGGTLFAFPYVAVLTTAQIVPIGIASVIMVCLGWSAASAAHTVVMPALFKAEYRSSGLFSSRELQGALVAGPAPLIASALVAASGGSPWLVGVLLVVTHVMTLVGLVLARPFLTKDELDTTPALQGFQPRD